MKKRILSLLLAVLMLTAILPAAALTGRDKFADTFFPGGKITTPQAPYIQHVCEGSESADFLYIFHYLPEDLLELGRVYAEMLEADQSFDEAYDTYCAYGLTCQIDGKVDGGSYHYNAGWDEMNYEANTDLPYYLICSTSVDVSCGTTNLLNQETLGWFVYMDPENEAADAGWLYPAITSSPDGDDGKAYHLDLKNHTLTFRCRYVLSYYSNALEDYVYLTSDWSPETSIGKKGTQKAPVKPTGIEAPVLSSFSMVTGENNAATASYYMSIPKSVSDNLLYHAVADHFEPYYLESQIRVNNGEWQDVYTANASWMTDGYRATGAANMKVGDSVQIRVRIVTDWDEGSSPWSNIVGTKTFQASPWAQGYMKQADELGLIPDCLADVDLTRQITRQEFAAVAVKVYEALTGAKTTPIAVNPFTDCSDPEVLKAYNVGITNGTAADKFSPNNTLSRQECATMLTRVYKKAVLKGWTLSTDGSYADTFKTMFTMPAAFADDADIAGWAKDSVYFMKAQGIIDGVGNNLFAPKHGTSAEESETYGLATREAALKIAVGMVNKLG